MLFRSRPAHAGHVRARAAAPPHAVPGHAAQCHARRAHALLESAGRAVGTDAPGSFVAVAAVAPVVSGPRRIARAHGPQ